MILRQASGADVIFDEEKSLSLEGDSGPYLQYATVRAKAILITAKEKGIEVGNSTDVPLEPYAIARIITRFPEVVARAAEELAPHSIAQYLTQLAGAWNSFYASERIFGGEHESYKLELAQAFVQTMENGLNLLAIPIPERM
jgi:arginyl-tRNA synthetase